MITRRVSPTGRVHIEAGDAVQMWKGTGTVRMLGPRPLRGDPTNYTFAIVEMDGGHARLLFDLNALVLLEKP